MKIIIGVSSGIAGYKVLDLIKLLKKRGYEVYIIMTENASKMFPSSSFEKASGNRIFISLFPKEFDYKNILKTRQVEHIKLASGADIIVIVPATANIIGKIANGFADDFLTTTVLATNAPILICPSMNTNMWNNPLVIENINKLKDAGYHILSPAIGKLACGTYGEGRLSEIGKIADEINTILKKKNRLRGKKIIVTAGGTQEAVDAVRVITNRSSGKMGIAIADESYLQGADILLIRAKNSVRPRYPVKEKFFESAKDLGNLIKKHIRGYDYIFHTAAVSDFIPEEKIDKKMDSSKSIILKLKSSPKICNYIKKWNPYVKLIGFKAVYKEKENDLVAKGFKKLKESSADYVMVNDVGEEDIGFSSDNNEVYVVSAKGLLMKIKKAPKKEVARQILEIIFQ